MRIQSLDSHTIFEYILSYNILEGINLPEDSVCNPCQEDKSRDLWHLKLLMPHAQILASMFILSERRRAPWACGCSLGKSC